MARPKATVEFQTIYGANSVMIIRNRRGSDGLALSSANLGTVDLATWRAFIAAEHSKCNSDAPESPTLVELFARGELGKR